MTYRILWAVLAMLGGATLAGCVPDVTSVNLGCSDPSCAPTVANVRNNGVLRSGFLVGSGANHVVEVSLDGGPFNPATGTSTWSFQLPTGASTWRESSVHTVTTRTVGSSATNTINVRKGVNLDINGDGYPDTAVGTGDLGGLTNNSVVYIYQSNGSGGLPTAATTVLNGTTPGNGDFFGYAIALGDINGDGYADLVVGAYGNGSLRAYVFRSTGSGGITGGAATSVSDTTIVNPLGGSTTFGASVAVGDVNGDGYADVAIGSNNTQQAVIYYSTQTSTSIVATSPNATLSGGGGFGLPVILGDVNGDGAADLIVSVSGAGGVDIFMSSPGSGIANGAVRSASITGLGSGQMSVADVNGDGFGDIVVAAGGNAANVFFSPGASGFTTIGIPNTSADVTFTGTGADGFGSGVTAGDINGDGFADVVVGAPTSGLSYVFLSSGATVVGAPYSSANAVLVGTAGGSYGGLMTMADVNGDGYQDLIVSDLAYSGNQGQAFSYLSLGTSGLSTSPAVTLFGPTASSFGWALPH